MVQRTRDGEVQTWLVTVAEAMPRYEALHALLSREEQDRAARYLHDAALHEFVVGRGCLRLLLGHGLMRAPSKVELTAGEHGKLQTSGVEFNLSHARGSIVIAVSAAGPVGVDIEYEDRAVEVLDVAEAAFTADERKKLSAAASPERLRSLFFALWTANEARAKCLGFGLSDLNRVRRHGSQLHVSRLTMPAGYQGALCLGKPALVVHEQFLSKEAITWLLNCRYDI